MKIWRITQLKPAFLRSCFKIFYDYPQNYPYEDESSNSHGQYIPPTASRQAPPVHEATGGHAVRGYYCIHNHLG